MKDFKECINCKAKHVEEFCSKCNGDFYSTLSDNFCRSCHGSLESACRHIRQKGDICLHDWADIRFFEEKWKDTDSTGTLCEE